MHLRGHDALVGVDHLLEVHGAFGDEGERRIGVVVAVERKRLFARQRAVRRDGGEDRMKPTGELQEKAQALAKKAFPAPRMRLPGPAANAEKSTAMLME